MESKSITGAFTIMINKILDRRSAIFARAVASKLEQVTKKWLDRSDMAGWLLKAGGTPSLFKRAALEATCHLLSGVIDVMPDGNRFWPNLAAEVSSDLFSELGSRINGYPTEAATTMIWFQRLNPSEKEQFVNEVKPFIASNLGIDEEERKQPLDSFMRIFGTGPEWADLKQNIRNRIAGAKRWFN